MTDHQSSHVLKQSAKHSTVVGAGLLAAAMSPLIAHAQNEKQLENVYVTADKPVRGSYQPGAIELNGQSQSLRDVPQAVTVVNQQLLKDQSASDLRDALKNVSGITFQAGEGGQTEVPVFRGFQAGGDSYINGVQAQVDFNHDAFNTDSVQVLKGSSSLLFGRGGATGVINTVTKSPFIGEQYQAAIKAGSYRSIRADVDANHAFNDNVAIRVNAVGDKEGSRRKPAENKTGGIAAAVAFGLNGPTRFEFGHVSTRQRNTPDYGVPYDITGERKPLMSLAGKYLGFANDYEDIDRHRTHAKISHQFNDKLRLSNHTVYADTDYETVLSAPRLKGENIDRSVKHRAYGNHTFSNQTDVNWQFETGNIRHDVNIGLDWVEDTFKQHAIALKTSRKAQGNALTPIAAPNPYDRNDNRLLHSGSSRLKTRNIGVSVGDTVTFSPQWKAVAGLRFDHIHNRFVSADGKSRLEKTDRVWSYRTGLIFQADAAQNYYLAYSTSFNPLSNRTTGQYPTLSAKDLKAKPEKTRTLEIGGKWQLANDRLMVGASVFRTDKDHERSGDIDGITQVDGKRHAYGVDVDLAGNITDKWGVFAGVNWLNAKVERSRNNNPDWEGHIPSNTPRFTANLWTSYAMTPQLTVGVGARYIGNRYTYLPKDRQRLPAYMVADAMIAYETPRYKLQMNVDNLFDKKYAKSGHRRQALLGDRRSVSLTAGIKF